MPNPLYSMLTGQQNPATNQQQAQNMMSGGPMFQNPVQKAAYILQAMQNPAAFVRKAIPDLPQNIANDPNQILRYLQQTRGITNQQIQSLAQQIPGY